MLLGGWRDARVVGGGLSIGQKGGKDQPRVWGRAQAGVSPHGAANRVWEQVRQRVIKWRAYPHRSN